jgi:hypothetical protein
MLDDDWAIGTYIVGKERSSLSDLEKKAKFFATSSNLYKADENADVPNIINIEDFRELNKPAEKVIKMTKSKYKNSFKENGKLNIGTHDFYQIHSNSEVRDEAEGSTLLMGLGSNYDIIAEVHGGRKNRLFCCYDGEPDSKVIEDFEYDAYYTIEDVEGFSNAINKHLQSTFRKYSRCLYSHYRAIYGELAKNYNPSIIDARIMNIIGAEKYFLKNSHFHNQKEFRFLWMSANNFTGSEVITCKEAIEFCSFN